MRIEVSQRVHLSEVRLGDKTALFQHLGEKEIYDRTLRIPHPYTRKEAARWVRSVVRSTAARGEPLSLAIRNADGELIGGFGFDGLEPGHKTEIGYWLAKPYWGQGIMTEVVAAACRHAFARWNLVRITAQVFAVNAASARVLEKCGFVLEGYLRKCFVKNGRFIDANLYALIANETVDG